MESLPKMPLYCFLNACFFIYLIPQDGDSLFVGDEGGQTLFRFAKRCLVYLWVPYLVHNWHIFGVADEKV